MFCLRFPFTYMYLCSQLLAPIIALESRKIVDVCCGYVHSVALDDQGQLFSWGGNKYGQLGNENDKSEISFVPK